MTDEEPMLWKDRLMMFCAGFVLGGAFVLIAEIW